MPRLEKVLRRAESERAQGMWAEVVEDLVLKDEGGLPQPWLIAAACALPWFAPPKIPSLKGDPLGGWVTLRAFVPNDHLTNTTRLSV